MSRRIIGNTVGTTISPNAIDRKIKPVKSVNGVAPDDNGNVEIPAGSGDAGVGIKSVARTTTSTADDGNNVITVTLTDGTKSTFKVQNGSKGSTGATGADGKTPVKGTDYWTEADKAEMVSDVIAALPVYDGSVVSV